jgi:ATP/maltotriose-dependent transcriptional regulator MalT/DNA-binding SARP family transcriptional activator
MRKITRPQSTGVFSRERLFGLLDRASTSQLIWISSPAGSGKTTLANSYVEARGLPCLWYQVDQGDSDLATFFYYMGLAWKKAVGPRVKPLPLFTPEYLLGGPTFARRFFETLYAKLPRPCVLVLDNYHEVPEDSAFHDVIKTGLAVAPDGIRVIVLSRTSPPPFVSGFIAGSTALGMSWEDLRLDADEAEGVVRMRLGESLTPEAVAEWHETAQGWVAGLILLMAGRTRAEGGMGQFPFGPAPGLIFDYFAAEIFERASSATRIFLLKTAFLSEMNAAMCEKVTGVNQPGRILSELNRRNFFTERLAGAGDPVYRYHALFREFLQSRAKAELPIEDLDQVMLSSAALLEEAGYVEDAARLYADSGQWKDLARLVQNWAARLLGEGRNLVLEGWLRSFPEGFVDGNPWLLYWSGACRLPYGPVEARRCFDRAFAKFKSDSDPQGICWSWHGAVESFLFEMGNLAPLDHWIAEMESFLDSGLPFPSIQIEIRVVAGMLHAILLRKPEKRELSRWVDRAGDLLKQYPDEALELRVSLLNPLLFHHNWMGEFTEGWILLEEFKESVPASAVAPSLRLYLLAHEAFLAWYTAQHDRCLKATRKGLDLAESTGIAYWNILFFSQGAHSALSSGDLATGAYYLDKMAHELRSGGRPYDVVLYHFNVAWESILRRDRRKAMEHARISLSMAVNLGAPWPTAIAHIGMAEVLIEYREYAAALSHFEKARASIRGMGSLCFEFKWLATRAYLAFEDDDEGGGLKYLARFMGLGKRRGYVSTISWRPDIIAPLCMKAIEAGVEVEYAQDLVRRRNLLPTTDCLHVENWPYPLKVYTLGTFEILRDGEPVSFSGKAQRKPLELLKALICLGGKGVSEWQLSDAVWPSAAGDLAHISFGTTLHRLRRLVGNEKALQLRDNRVSLDERYCWLDAWAFESLCLQADSAWRKDRNRTAGPGRRTREAGSESTKGAGAGAAAEAESLAKKAIALYGGHFLHGDTEESWAISMRERLRSRFTRIVTALGQCLQEAMQWEEAVECFLTGLEADDLVEEFYRQLMLCYQRLGDHARALSVYHRCHAVLGAALGAEPAPSIQSLYRSIKGS